MLAHREAGARLLVAGDAGDDVAGAEAGQRLQLAGGGALAVGVEEGRAELLVQLDRRVGGGVGAAGDADVDLPEGDLVGDQDRRLEAGAAGLLDVVGGGLGGEAGGEDALAGQVAVVGVLQDGAAGDLAERLALEAEAVDQPVERGGEHVLVGRVRVLGVGAREGDPVAADDGDPAGLACSCLGGSFPGFAKWGGGGLGAGADARLDRGDQELGRLAGGDRLGAQPPAGELLGGAEEGGGERLDFDPGASRRAAGSWARSEPETSATIWPR